MAITDKVFLRAFRWFKTTADDLQAAIAGNGAVVDLAAPLTDLLRTRLGLQLDRTEAAVDPASFAASRAEAHSMAVAALVTGEVLAALRTLGEVLQALEGGGVGLDELSQIVQQIDRIVGAQPGKPPSAYSLAKLLLILSGDADEPDNVPPARKLVRLLKNDAALSDDQAAQPQMVLGLALIVAGTFIDRAFSGATLPTAGAAIPLPGIDKRQSFMLARSDDAGKKLDLTIGLNTAAAEARLFAQLVSSLQTAVANDFQLAFSASVKTEMALPALEPLPAVIPRPSFEGDVALGLQFGRKRGAAPLLLGPQDGTHFSIGELSGGITLDNAAPRLQFDLQDSRLVLAIGDDPFLGAIIGERIEVALTFGLIADSAGGLRLKEGTGLKATIPLETIPDSPVQIPFLTFELRKADGLNSIEVELSGSFQVQIGPFSGSIDRLGSKLDLQNLLGGVTQARWGLKPPSGAGLAIDAGVMKGGGFLLFDPERGEYGGILDIKLMQIGVKAIGLLGTRNPQGWSLLLIITAQLPPIQLGFGFTLTGLGGLIGVQHTIDKDALSSGLSSGSLDSFLFPQNPVANAPQIFNQLRVIFPFRAGGFIIGPMLELGWGTPSLVTGRLGLLIEPSQLVFVGQVIVQLPPLVDEDLALLRLQVDFAGGVVFDPLQIWFDGVLRDSRVLFISLHGQFAFRAIFGDHPTFLISAGGFHPRFTDLPPGLPSPFQRVGCEFSIGIVGMRFDGYFAVTSASVQGGSSLRVWGDVGIASFEGGFEFNAIVYLVPRFRFETDIHIFAGVEVFGIDFASVDIYGLLAGPGRWHVVGRATVHTPWPLPDFHFHVDETWGEDRDTVVRRLTLLDELKKELEKATNWSAQLAQGGEAFATFARLPEPQADAPKPLIAHPNAVLQFVQKRMPLAKKLDKLGSDGIEGERQIAIDRIVFGAIEKPADKWLTDNFSAAQFLELDKDDLLAKPSFDRFTSGLEVGQRDYQFGAAIGDVFDFEEVNLSIEKSGAGVLAMPGLTLAQHRTWALEHGAASRSPVHRRRALEPEDEVKIAVNPAPLAAIDQRGGTMSGPALSGMAATSFWHAEEAVAQMREGVQVVEQFENAS